MFQKMSKKTDAHHNLLFQAPTVEASRLLLRLGTNLDLIPSQFFFYQVTYEFLNIFLVIMMHENGQYTYCRVVKSAGTKNLEFWSFL